MIFISDCFVTIHIEHEKKYIIKYSDFKVMFYEEEMNFLHIEMSCKS